MTASKPVTAIANALEIFFAIFLMQLIVNTLCNTSDEFEGFLLCRKCGLEITRADSLVNIPSSLAHRQRNDTLSGTKGILIQLFKNPDGVYFELVSSTEAEVQKVHKAYTEHSWFPGFSWTLALCPRCGQHLGWAFDPVSKDEVLRFQKHDSHTSAFTGLILANLLHEQEAESIIAVPKTYHS